MSYKEFYVRVTDDLTLEQIVVKGVELGYALESIDYNYDFVDFNENAISSEKFESDCLSTCELAPSDFLALTADDVRPKKDVVVFGLLEGLNQSSNIKYAVTQDQIDRIKAILEES